jgi:hypothetical protein
MNLQPEQAALNAVEWLAALWDLCAPGPSQAANAHLAALVRVASDLRLHDACAWLDRERRVSSRDQLVKRVVTAAYRQTDDGNISASFHQLCADIPQVLGPALYGLLREARDEARARVEVLAGHLDPVGDVAEITGEPIPMRVVIAPSLFLPPPQAGRHGVLLRGGETVAHLHFGFPLERDPCQYDINRAWLIGGTWHYALRLYTNRYWPGIARRLAACADLEEAVSALAADTPAGRVAPGEPRWIRWLEHHLHVTLKRLLYRQRGGPDDAVRLLNELQGYSLMSWFDSWLARGLSSKVPLADVLATLPDALRRERSDWEALAGTAAPPPLTLNFALLSRSAGRAVLVFPDDWSEPAVQAAAAGWRAGPMPIVRCSGWLAARGADAAPVIAFGEPASNTLVRTVLEQRGLPWPPCPSDSAAVVALSTAPVAGAQWCIAVAVSRPEVAATLKAHAFRARCNAYVLFDRGEVIGDNCRAADAEVATTTPLVTVAQHEEMR